MTAARASDPFATIYVTTVAIKAAVDGREEDILGAIGITKNRARNDHITCPYPAHGGENDWRWDTKTRRAYCTCTKSDSIFDVVAKVEGLSFEDAKIRVAEILGREDLIRTKGARKGQKTDPASLLSPTSSQEDPELPRAYLAHRLGVEPADVVMPVTKSIGWKELDYVEKAEDGSGKFVVVGSYPCAVFATVGVEGRSHAHRIYCAPGGAGKAALGKTSANRDRDPKKSAKTDPKAASISGLSVLWGSAHAAPHILLAEGIETAAALALCFKLEIEAGGIAVAAAITAGGVEAFQPYPATKRVTVAADRDEKPKPGKATSSRRGEQASRKFGLKHHETIAVDIALPGNAGESVDWLDVLRADGVDQLRDGIQGARTFTPSQEETDLSRVGDEYPLPFMSSQHLEYQLVRGEPWVHKAVLIGKGENQQTVLLPVCTPFGIPARLRFVGQDTYGLRVVVRDMKGVRRQIDVDRGELSRLGGAEARSMLLSVGLRVEDGGEAIAVDCLKVANPDAEIAIVRRPGWHLIDDRPERAFVAPSGQILGLATGTNLELSVAAQLLPRVAKGGTFAGWKAAVQAAMAVTDCPHWTIGIIGGFAGPIMSLLGLNTCGINFSGRSSSGKTTSLKLAASIWAMPDEKQDTLLQTAKATVNSIEHMAARASGTVFALDELAHVSGREVAKIIYTLASNVGKRRMTASALVRESYSWSTFALLSSETSLEAKIKGDDGDWTAGQAVRIADVDVTNINRTVDAATMHQIDGITSNFGHAGPAFVEAMIAEGAHNRTDELKTAIKTIAQNLASGKSGHPQDSARLRAAFPFAVLAMAGAMAKKYGILPADVDLKKAVWWAWEGFANSSDAAILDPVAYVIPNLQTWIAERWRSSIQDIDGERIPGRDALGWFDDKAVYIPDRRLVEAAGGTLKEAEVAKALNTAGVIQKRVSPNHLYVAYVPRIGKVKAYALSRQHFGRGSEAGEERQQRLHILDGDL